LFYFGAIFLLSAIFLLWRHFFTLAPFFALAQFFLLTYIFGAKIYSEIVLRPTRSYKGIPHERNWIIFIHGFLRISFIDFSKLFRFFFSTVTQKQFACLFSRPMIVPAETEFQFFGLKKKQSGRCRSQGCQMVCFQTQNPNLGKFWRTIDWKVLIYFTAIGIFYGHLGSFTTIWYILCSFGTFFLVWVSSTYLEKSGNPGWSRSNQVSALYVFFSFDISE
jgi:hypothetical protein